MPKLVITPWKESTILGKIVRWGGYMTSIITAATGTVLYYFFTYILSQPQKIHTWLVNAFLASPDRSHSHEEGSNLLSQKL